MRATGDRTAGRRLAPYSPSWSAWRGLLYVILGQALRVLARVWRSQRGQKVVHTALILLGLVTQAVMLLVAAYLCDLALSLMELWADLATKHLELTL